MGKIVDLSHHQGTIDFAKFSKECDLAIVRVQYGSGTVDRKYKEYVAGLKKYGVPFGHYAYARFVSVADAKVEAKDFIARADKAAKFLVVDVEELTCPASQVVAATQAFVDVCKAAGFKVGLYTGHHFYAPYRMDKVNADFLWIPRYASNDNGTIHNVKPTMDCDIWQYSQCGKIAGVQGYVDLNVLNGEKTLAYFTGKKVTKPVAQQSVKVGDIDVDGYVKVTTDVWMHSKPDFETASRIRVLKAGEIYKAYGNADGMVSLGGGYVSENYVDDTYQTAECTTNVWTHKTPDVNASSRGQILEKGSQWKVYGETNNGMFKVGSEYVSKDYMKLV